MQKAIAASLIVILVGTTGVAMASQNSLPGHPFYPVKILTEDLRVSLSASPETKAKLETEFAARRVAEVKIMLEKNSPEPQMLEVALNRLQLNTSNAVNIVNSEKEKGKDVSDLAKNLNDDFDKSQEELENIMNQQEDNIKKQKQEIKIRITTVKQAGNSAQAEILAKQFEELANRKKITEVNLSANKDMMETKLADIEKHMKEKERAAKAQKDAQKTIAEAENANRELTNGLTAENAASVADMMQQFNAVFAKAEEAFDDGSYAEAENMAKEARDIVREAEKIADETEYDFKEDKNSRSETEKRRNIDLAPYASPRRDNKEND